MSRPKIVIKTKNSPEQVPEKTPPVNQPTTPEKLEGTPKEAENSESKSKPIRLPSWVKAALLIIPIVLLSLVAYYYFFLNNKSEQATEIIEENKDNSEYSNYDTIYEDFEKDILSQTTNFSTLMNTIGVAGADINLLNKKSGSFNISTLRKGDKFSIYYDDEEPVLIVIEPKTNPYNKIEIDLNEIGVKKVAKKREIRIREMAGIVETNLGITFINNNLNLQLINKLEEIFEYSVDLFQVDDGDRFKILYEQEFLDGKPFDVRGIRAAYIKEGNRDYYAFMKKEGNKVNYYNEFGESMKRSFLSSPIKYGGVVTSGFGLRVHPKLGYRKMHLGTDYAAAEGTPIVAVADGIVTGRAFAGDNGNFIKLTHDKVFETQYLHMQKFNPVVKLGSRVKQGDVIGYVGMTGLATGPHVCFRFKKDGQQVNPKDHDGGVTSRLQGDLLTDYKEKIEPMKKSIKKIEYF